jgi:hypothetical protein
LTRDTPTIIAAPDVPGCVIAYSSPEQHTPDTWP